MCSGLRCYALQFVRDRLRIRDVRLYVKDLLLEYHRLQKFSPVVSKRARCIDWERMLEEFQWPHYNEVTIHSVFVYVHQRSDPSLDADWSLPVSMLRRLGAHAERGPPRLLCSRVQTHLALFDSAPSCVHILSSCCYSIRTPLGRQAELRML